jgi:hypothetical protein
LTHVVEDAQRSRLQYLRLCVSRSIDSRCSRKFLSKTLLAASQQPPASRRGGENGRTNRKAVRCLFLNGVAAVCRPAGSTLFGCNMAASELTCVRYSAPGRRLLRRARCSTAVESLRRPLLAIVPAEDLAASCPEMLLRRCAARPEDPVMRKRLSNVGGLARFGFWYQTNRMSIARNDRSLLRAPRNDRGRLGGAIRSAVPFPCIRRRERRGPLASRRLRRLHRYDPLERR